MTSNAEGGGAGGAEGATSGTEESKPYTEEDLDVMERAGFPVTSRLRATVQELARKQTAIERDFRDRVIAWLRTKRWHPGGTHGAVNPERIASALDRKEDKL